VLTAGACAERLDPLNTARNPVTLVVGFGLATGTDPNRGIEDTARSFALERLVAFSHDGRPQARLAERWQVADNGLTLRVWLRAGATFHDGEPVTASLVRDAIAAAFPPSPAPTSDVREIFAHGTDEIEIRLNRRSAFVFEGLEIAVQRGDQPIGTGPFVVTRTGEQTEMSANPNYYAGRPLIDRILLKPYASVRAAWADMLRGEVDMLYEVGQDALDSLQPSSNVKVFTMQRPYAYVMVPNMSRPALRDPGFRRALNASIDREALVADVFGGHATPADGPVAPNHWAYDPTLPRFQYAPKTLAPAGSRPRFTLLFPDASLERLVLHLQRQFQAVGVDLDPQLLSLNEFNSRAAAGDFDFILQDAALGPTMMRASRFWYTGERLNFGRFSSRKVDAALDAIREASDDDAAYRAGVAAYQQAIIDDPPGIFLLWSERSRAVSTRFEVPPEPGEILVTLRSWRPVGASQLASRH
jgi:peptide/nickel transport system substrate-binding protein